MSNMTKQTESDYWEKIRRDEPVTAISKCEEAAKQLITLISLTITIYVGVISFGDLLKQPMEMRQALLFILLPLPFWLFSLSLAILVIIPRSYTVNQIREDYIKISQKKYRFLLWSYVLLIASMIALVVVIVIYILYIPPIVVS